MATFAPSKYQQIIFHDIKERALHNIVISAGPGSGKTETMRRMIPFIDPTMSVVTLAFNVDAAEQFGARVTETRAEMRANGQRPPLVNSMNIHKLGTTTLKNASIKWDKKDGKYRQLTRAFLEFKGLKDAALTKAIADLIDKARLTLSGFYVSVEDKKINVRLNEMELALLCKRFKIADLDPKMPFEWNLMMEGLPLIIQKGLWLGVKGGEVDFTDMLWIPIVMNYAVPQFDYVLVDECQDLSPLQLEIVLRARRDGGYFVAVGDRHQAIYGFAGASLRSIDEIIERTGATERKLSICYRCPRNIVKLASTIYPGIEFADYAPEGVLDYVTKFQVKEMVRAGDLVLSRTTARIVELCLDLLRQGKRANVRGRDLGGMFEGLLDAIRKHNKKFNARTFKDLDIYALDYKTAEIARLGDDPENEGRIERLMDNIDTLMTLFTAYMTYFKDVEHQDTHPFKKFMFFPQNEIFNGRGKTPPPVPTEPQTTPTLEGFKWTMKFFFSEDPDAQIILSTGHRAKGLEYPRVFILGYEDIPHPRAEDPEEIEQEYNLLYVMVTRAKFSMKDGEWKQETGHLYLEVENVAVYKPIETAPAAPQEEKKEEKKGRPATGRIRKQKQYSLDAALTEQLATIASSPEAAAMLGKLGLRKNFNKKGEVEALSASEVFEILATTNPLLAQLLKATEPEPEPDPDNGGGAPSPDHQEKETQEEEMEEHYAFKVSEVSLSREAQPTQNRARMSKTTAAAAPAVAAIGEERDQERILARAQIEHKKV